MHPPERGFGKPPRSQQPDRTASGSRPFLQGHLKPSRKRSQASSAEGTPEAASGPNAAAAKKPRTTKPAGKRPPSEA